MNFSALCQALLQYRNTPSRKDGQSPAQKLFGRPIQDTLPAHCCSFAPEWQRSTFEAEQLAEHTQKQTEAYYNRHAHEFQDIQVGSTVALQNPRTKLWNIYGTAVNVSPYRQYSVKTHSGCVLVRNRRFLRCSTPASTVTLDGSSQQHSSSSQNLSQDFQTPAQHPQTPPQELRRSDHTTTPDGGSSLAIISAWLLLGPHHAWWGGGGKNSNYILLHCTCTYAHTM